MKLVKHTIKLILSLVPEIIPQGRTAFNKFVDDVIALAQVPNNDSTKEIVCGMILRLEPTQSHVTKFYFFRALKKAAGAEVAYVVLQELQKKRKEEFERMQQEAAKAAKEEAERAGQETQV